MTRRQFVLDKKSNKVLNELAADRDGNHSRVVRQAILHYADSEAYLDKIESDPAFIAMMERSEAAFRAGQVISHEEVVRRHLALRKKGK